MRPWRDDVDHSLERYGKGLCVYLTQKRVERAQEMLAQTDLSLSEIAYATGFSDQSHLARHFRHLLGTTPREFRWSQS